MCLYLDKQALLKRVRESRAELEALLAEFDDARMDESHPPDGWSVKDTLAHIAYWEGYALARFREAARGEKPQMLGAISEAEINRINQEALKAGRARSLDEVKAAFRQTHQALWDELAAIPENRGDAWWALWPEPDTPWNLITYNTYHHYGEHIQTLQTWRQ